MKDKIFKENLIMIFGIVFMLFLIGFVISAPSFKSGSYNTTYYFVEDSFKNFNVSNNLTNPGDIMLYRVLNITSTEHSEIFHSNYSWLPWNDTQFSDSNTGILDINSLFDNQTGNFTLEIYTKDRTDNVGMSVPYNFIINATNDYPEFLEINNTYNITQENNLSSYISAYDEEQHYPLKFNISFWNNCSHAAFSSRANCSLFEMQEVLDSNITSLMNFTPKNNDAGIYWANITVTDLGGDSKYGCPHKYCDNSSYEQNKTTLYTSSVRFEVFADMAINASDCQNKIFQQNETSTCYINITTKTSNSNIKIFSNASLRNYNTPDWINDSWFYTTNNTNSDNYILTAYINVTPEEREVGNWSINFSIKDNYYGNIVSELIYVYVNKTKSTSPIITSINNQNVSTEAPATILFNITDNDFLIPDKNSSYGGFNEDLNLSYIIYNQSDLTQQMNLSNFSLKSINMPITGTNITTAKLVLTANTSDVGDYTINVSSIDEEGNIDYELFNMTIFSNNYPLWNSSLGKIVVLNENNNFYLNLSQNTSDADGDELTFSYSLESGISFNSFTKSFNSSTGEINLSLTDKDVGLHLVNITVSDGYLTNTTLFNFTINNVHDTPRFDSISYFANCSANATQINLTEDNASTVQIKIVDEDFNITSAQILRGYYNESLTIVNTTITNTTGAIIDNMFNFTLIDDSFKSSGWLLYGFSFNPNKTYVGEYNASFYFRDANGTLGNWTFKLYINEISHAPVLYGADTNKSAIINSSFYYNFNASDIEDGSDSLGNLSFNITFISGNNFIKNNKTIFNTTTGELNFYFNSSCSGKYHLNLSVNDTAGTTTSESFWIFVYDVPEINFPSIGHLFNFSENNISIFNLTLNSTLGENLTIELWTDFIKCAYQNNSNCNYTALSLRQIYQGYGNNSISSLSFTPNFTDETYSNLKNMTLIIYPNTTGLNYSQLRDISINRTFKLNITHIDDPISFTGNIPDLGPTTYDNDIIHSLSSYFKDADYSDGYYKQDINFSAYSNTSSSSITTSFSGLSVTFSASSAVKERFNISANSSNTLANSDNFLVEFTAPSTRTVTTPTSGGGGGGSSETEVPVMLKIVVPGSISGYTNDRITVPLKLKNTGDSSFQNVVLDSSVSKNNELRKDFVISFSKNNFNTISPGDIIDLIMTIEVDTTEQGKFEININATSETPSYTDWSKIYLEIKEPNDVEEKILFATDFILENPECAELTEIVKEARNFLNKGDTELALEKAALAVDACKDIIASQGRFRFEESFEKNFYRYLIMFLVSVILIFLSYYFYRRHKLKVYSNI